MELPSKGYNTLLQIRSPSCFSIDLEPKRCRYIFLSPLAQSDTSRIRNSTSNSIVGSSESEGTSQGKTSLVNDPKTLTGGTQGIVHMLWYPQHDIILTGGDDEWTFVWCLSFSSSPLGKVRTGNLKETQMSPTDPSLVSSITEGDKVTL